MLTSRNERAIKEYIRNQLEEDYTKDQMTLKEYVDPFTVEGLSLYLALLGPVQTTSVMYH